MSDPTEAAVATSPEPPARARRPQSAPHHGRTPARVRPQSAGSVRSHVSHPLPVRDHPSHRWPVATCTDVPGPGHYEPYIPGMRGATAVRIGQNKRIRGGDCFYGAPGEGAPESTPGPAMYEVREAPLSTRLAHKFFKGQRGGSKIDRGSTPGPGGYDPPLNPSDHVSAHPQSFGVETRETAARRGGELPGEGPGPGAYGSRDKWTAAGPAWRIGRSKRAEIWGRREGVSRSAWRTRFFHCDANGEDEPPLRHPQDPGKPAAPAMSFTKGQRGTGISGGGMHTANPGPGAYDYAGAAESTRRASPAISFGKSAARQPRMNPGLATDTGVTALREGFTTLKAGGSTIGKAKRGFAGDEHIKAAADIPGPNAYEPQLGDGLQRRPAAKKFRFSAGPRQARDPRTLGPGPGGYENAAASKQMALGSGGQVTFGRSARGPEALSKEREGFPGPGTYDISRKRQRIKGVRRHEKKLVRDPFCGLRYSGEGTPGPQYDVSTFTTRVNTPAVSFTRADARGARKVNAGVPGPGPADYRPAYTGLQPSERGAMLYLTG
eukprot:Hpha_TRINITY_DN16146_c1_g10::TRINITY_DN16146_c1_g10_i1::g.3833::m.3833